MALFEAKAAAVASALTLLVLTLSLHVARYINQPVGPNERAPGENRTYREGATYAQRD